MRSSWCGNLLIEFTALVLGALLVSCLHEGLEMRSVGWGSNGCIQRLFADMVLRVGMYVALRSLICGCVRIFGPRDRRPGAGDLYASVVAEMQLERERVMSELPRNRG